MSLVFVNLKGEPVRLDGKSVAYKPTKEPLKRVTDRAKAKESDGFLVTGYSPAQMATAEVDHEAMKTLQANKIAAGQKLEPKEKIIGAWSAETYMNTNKPKRVRSKAYEIPEAADLCAQMARKAGWLRVDVDEIMKG